MPPEVISICESAKFKFPVKYTVDQVKVILYYLDYYICYSFLFGRKLLVYKN